MEIWQHLDIAHVPGFLCHDVLLWIHQFARNMHSVTFLTAMWWCWRRCNQDLLGGECWSSAQVLCRISAMTDDIDNAFSSPLVTEDCSSSTWLPPPPSWLKVNVDGSFYWSLNRGGFGGVLRDNNGIWLGGFSGETSKCDVLHNEIYAIFQGLSFAWEKGFKEVLIR